MKRLIPILAVLVVALAGGAWWVTSSNTQKASKTPVHVETVDVSESDIAEMTLGSADAKVTIIEYASFTCPHCANFHATAYKELKSDYIDTGKVRFVFREAYFDRAGLWASLIARCGGEERFFGMTDLLFKGQNTWGRANGEAAVAAELRKIGRLAGLDDTQLNACLNDQAKMEQLVGWYQKNFERDGIKATPTLIINGTVYPNMAYGDLKTLIEKALTD